MLKKSVAQLSSGLNALVATLQEATEFHEQQPLSYQMPNPRMVRVGQDYMVTIPFGHEERHIFLTFIEVQDAVRQVEQMGTLDETQTEMVVSLPVSAAMLYGQFKRLLEPAA